MTLVKELESKISIFKKPASSDTKEKSNERSVKPQEPKQNEKKKEKKAEEISAEKEKKNTKEELQQKSELKGPQSEPKPSETIIDDAKKKPETVDKQPEAIKTPSNSNSKTPSDTHLDKNIPAPSTQPILEAPPVPKDSLKKETSEGVPGADSKQHQEQRTVSSNQSSVKRKHVIRDDQTSEIVAEKKRPEEKPDQKSPLVQDEYPAKPTQAQASVNPERIEKKRHEREEAQIDEKKEMNDAEKAEMQAKIEQSLNDNKTFYWLFVLLNYWQLIAGLFLGLILGKVLTKFGIL